MDRVNLPFFYQLGAKLSPLAHLAPGQTQKGTILMASIGVLPDLNTLLGTFGGLSVCRSSADALNQAIREINALFTKLEPADAGKAWSELLNPNDFWFQQVISRALQFETVLSAELATLATYHVTQKGIYSTADLIERAENALSPSVVAKLDSQMTLEIREAGKCLAFDVPTAAGFHTMRAVEAVLHAYYVEVCQPSDKDAKLDNWGAYISALHKRRTATPDPDIQEVEVLLQQLKDRHRNLIMHPEIVLNADDAFTLFEIAQGVILAMAKKLPDRQASAATSETANDEA